MQINPNANVQRRINKIVPREKIINKLKKMDVPVFTFLSFLKTLNKFKKKIIKIINRNTIPKITVYRIPSSITN